MFAALNTLIEILFYGLTFLGAFLLFHHIWADAFHHVKRMYYGFSNRQLLRISEGFRMQKKNKPAMTFMDKVHDHIEMLLHATLKHPSPRGVPRFLILSLSLGAVVFLLAFSAGLTILLAVFSGFVIMSVPYFALHIRYYHLSIQNSYSFGILLDALVPEYRKQHGSMMHALKAAIQQIPEGSMQRSLARLTDRLANYVTDYDVKTALRRFIAELGTSWSIQLANDIEHALLDGVNVEHSLTMTHKEFMDIEEVRKGQKLARLDSLLVAVVPFIVWPIMMFMFYVYLTRNIFYYQFGTPTGFEWFIITFICTFGSFLIGVIFYRPKQDL